MKKLLTALLMLTLVFSLAACDDGEEDPVNGEDPANGEDDPVELGDYKPGLHLGYTEGNENTFAYVYVDAQGFIDDIHIDSVYTKSADDGPVWDVDDESSTYNAVTKRSLDDGCEYNMNSEAGSCEPKEDGLLLWHEQVDALSADIVEAQAIPDYSMTEGKLDDDAISGVSVTVSYLITAVENALDRAALGSDEVPTDFDVPEFDSEGDYTPGIQYGYSEGSSNGHAFLAVNEEGNIEHAAIDVVYFKTTDAENAVYSTMGHGGETQGIVTTKMSLNYGADYGMHRDDDGNVIDGEMAWEEQMEALADDVVANQALEDYTLDGGAFASPDDAVAGVSITVDHVIEALEMALAR